jgi:hypothetical protein
MAATFGALSALQAVLAAEDAAIFGYGVVGAHLAGSRLAAAEQDWTGHNRARDTLAGMISRLGAVPVAAQAFYQLPFAVHDAATATALAAYLEDGVTRAYLGLVAVSDPGLRGFGALTMQGSAERAAYWRGRTQAFPGLPASALLPARSAAESGLPAVQGHDPGGQRPGSTAGWRTGPSRHHITADKGRRSVLAAMRSKYVHDGGGGQVKVVGYGDPLRPRPPEPPDAILTATRVDVLLERPGPRVRYVQAGHAPRRFHQPGLKPPVRQLVGQLFQVNRLHLVRPVYPPGPLGIAGPSGFHRHHHCYLSRSIENLTLLRLQDACAAQTAQRTSGKSQLGRSAGTPHFPTHPDALGRTLVH